jgi:hypothetical protein
MEVIGWPRRTTCFVDCSCEIAANAELSRRISHGFEAMVTFKENLEMDEDSKMTKSLEWRL